MAYPEYNFDAKASYDLDHEQDYRKQEVRPSSPVNATVSNLSESIMILEDTTQALQNRLQSVLDQTCSSTTNDSTMDAPEPVCELAGNLASLRNRVESANSRLSSILQGLQL